MSTRHDLPSSYQGVKLVRSDTDCDCYSGPKDALIAAGLATADEFPAQPGKNKYSVNLRPPGAKPEGGAWCWAPGFRTIRVAGYPDRFYISMNVSLDERERRRQAEMDREAPSKADAAPVMSHKVEPARVERHGNVVFVRDWRRR